MGCGPGRAVRDVGRFWRFLTAQFQSQISIDIKSAESPVLSSIGAAGCETEPRISTKASPVYDPVGLDNLKLTPFEMHSYSGRFHRAIPIERFHRFRPKGSTHSDWGHPPIPTQRIHWFRTKPSTFLQMLTVSAIESFHDHLMRPIDDRSNGATWWSRQ
jgi:hypothetical protein